MTQPRIPHSWYVDGYLFLSGHSISRIRAHCGFSSQSAVRIVIVDTNIPPTAWCTTMCLVCDNGDVHFKHVEYDGGVTRLSTQPYIILGIDCVEIHTLILEYEYEELANSRHEYYHGA